MQVLEEVAELVSSKYSMFKTLAAMVRLEARLAGLSIFPMLLTLAVLIVFGLSFWVSTLILLGYLLYQFFQSMLIAILLVVIINFIGVALAAKSLITNIKNMSFSRTRKYLLKNKKEQDELQEKENHQETK